MSAVSLLDRAANRASCWYSPAVAWNRVMCVCVWMVKMIVAVVLYTVGKARLGHNTNFKETPNAHP